MPISSSVLKELIESGLPGAIVQIEDLAGDGDHYSATVEATQFVGKTMVQQHQMVYDALQRKMGGDLHALALKTIIKE